VLIAVILINTDVFVHIYVNEFWSVVNLLRKMLNDLERLLKQCDCFVRFEIEAEHYLYINVFNLIETQKVIKIQ